MANGKIRFGKQSGGQLALIIPDGATDTEVIFPETGVLATKQDVENSVVKLTGDQTIEDVKTFSSNIVGDITGSANYATSAGSADTATKLQTARTINGVEFDGSNNIVVEDSTKVALSGNQTINDVKIFTSSPIVPTPTTDFQVANKAYVDDAIVGYGGTGGGGTGNSATATKLQTARTINGVAFDGSANITVSDSTAVKLTENQTIAGIKTFSSSPIVPTPTANTQAANKAYVDSNSGFTGFKAALNASGTAPIYACRAWVNFNGTGTVAIRASGNVSSITDNRTGDYTVNFTTAMPDANFAVTSSYSRDNTGTATNNDGQCFPYSYYTSSISVSTTNGNAGKVDSANINVAIFR